MLIGSFVVMGCFDVGIVCFVVWGLCARCFGVIFCILGFLGLELCIAVIYFIWIGFCGFLWFCFDWFTVLNGAFGYSCVTCDCFGLFVFMLLLCRLG